MALSTFVKVGNITNLSDARYCAGMGVDEIGFCTNPDSKAYLSPIETTSIQGWVSGVTFVAEGIPMNGDQYEYDKVQIGIEEIQLLPEVPKIIELDFTNLDLAENISGLVDYFLIDDEEKTELSREDKDKITQFGTRFPVVLGFGFNANTIRDLLTELPLKGIAMKGSEEIRPGFKDYDELADILEQLELDD